MSIPATSASISPIFSEILYKNFDHNKDQTLTPHEIKNELKKLDIKPKNLVQALFRNNQKEIVIGLRSSVSIKISKESFDKNNDTALNHAELATYIKQTYELDNETLIATLITTLFELSQDYKFENGNWEPVITLNHLTQFENGELFGLIKNKKHPTYTLISEVALKPDLAFQVLTDNEVQNIIHPYLTSAKEASVEEKGEIEKKDHKQHKYFDESTSTETAREEIMAYKDHIPVFEKPLIPINYHAHAFFYPKEGKAHYIAHSPDGGTVDHHYEFLPRDGDKKTLIIDTVTLTPKMKLTEPYVHDTAFKAHSSDLGLLSSSDLWNDELKARIEEIKKNMAPI